MYKLLAKFLLAYYKKYCFIDCPGTNQNQHEKCLQNYILFALFYFVTKYSFME